MERLLNREILFHAMRLESYDLQKSELRRVKSEIDSLLLSDLSNAQKIKRAKEIVSTLAAVDIARDAVIQSDIMTDDNDELLLLLLLAMGVLITTESLTSLGIESKRTKKLTRMRQTSVERLKAIGFTLKETQSENLANTKKKIVGAVKIGVNNEQTPQEISQAIETANKTRLAQTLATAGLFLTASRAYVLWQQNRECKHWKSYGIADSRQTNICSRLTGKEYKMKYSDIPDKPPRYPPIHNCRSWLAPMCGNDAVEASTLSQHIKTNPDLIKTIAGKKALKEWQDGGRTIETFADLRRNNTVTPKTIRGF